MSPGRTGRITGGLIVGVLVAVGLAVGLAVGRIVGLAVGRKVGLDVGILVGAKVGAGVGVRVTRLGSMATAGLLTISRSRASICLLLIFASSASSWEIVWAAAGLFRLALPPLRIGRSSDKRAIPAAWGRGQSEKESESEEESEDYRLSGTYLYNMGCRFRPE